MKLNIERGARRIIWAVSWILLTLSSVLYFIYLFQAGLDLEPYSVVLLLLFIPTLIAIALSWALFFAVKWIIAGFKNE